MWIAIAFILATCRIAKAKGEDGEEITPAAEFSNGIVKYVYLFSSSSIFLICILDAAI